MSKRQSQTDRQPEIDATYEQRFAALEALPPGHVTDYAIEPARPERAQPQPRAWVPGQSQQQQPPVVARRIVEPIDIIMPQQSVMSVDVRTSARDRAEGFSIETNQLSLVAGLFAVLVAVVGFDHPLVTLGTLWTFGLWYTLAWLAAWLFHRVISPEGLAFFNALMMWRYINRR